MRLRSQSAMEYLMTYGWAILIIAVALAVLFSLSVFNQGANVPKAGVGSCQVYRPNGPGTTAPFINLEGSCLNLQPNFVAQFSGASSYIQIPTTPSLGSSTQVTISVWVYIPSITPLTPCANILRKQTGTSDSNYNIYLGNGICIGDPFHSSVYANAGGVWTGVSPGSQQLSANTWYNIVWSYTSLGGGYLYLNGASQGGPAGSGNLITNNDNVLIGGVPVSMSNIQIYNTSLSAAQVQALYKEGIGGDPITLQNLVAWWPLNGNSNDYSGNNNNGADSNVAYSSVWQSGYTHP